MKAAARPLATLAVAVLFGLPFAFTSTPISTPTRTPGPSPFLLQETAIRATVTGPIAHVEVTQVWHNPNPVAVDGVYVFPLPEDGAVTDLTLRVGAREIRSAMKRRQEARADFEAARAEGRLAGLLDQERPNVFAQQIANLVPGETVEVVLSLDHPVRCEDGACEWVFPTVVGPRFVPASLADPGRILPPVAGQGQGTEHVLSLALDLEPGVSMHAVESPSHPLRIVLRGDRAASLTLDAEAAARLDRDLRVRFKLGGQSPEAGVLAWRDPAVDPLGTAAIVLQPPAGEVAGPVARRELVFVLDCSGSMQGEPIEAAKEVVRRALRGARPGDTFQILRFSESPSGMAERPLPFSPDHVKRALAYLDTLQGEGGTQMIEGIRAALAPPPDADRLRVVAFLTDGYIGNETEILAEVRRTLGEARLFSFGIGSSVNRYLLESLAEEGRGAAAFLGTKESPDALVARFVARIDAPVLTDVRLVFEGLAVSEQEPAEVPDLFAGQPLLLHARYAQPGAGVLRVEGMRGGRPYAFTTAVVLPERAEDHEALGRLWARARLHRLEREALGGSSEALREAIVTLGLKHRLVTPYTSLVAVDSVVSNPGGGAESLEVPVELPLGVSREGVFGKSGEVARLASLGYVAAGGTAAEQPAPRTAKFRTLPRREADPAASQRPVAWGRLDWTREDGSVLTVEADGELWEERAGHRSLRRKLSIEERATLAALLLSVPTAAWTGSGNGASLTLVTPEGVHHAALPPADPALRALAAALEKAAGSG